MSENTVTVDDIKDIGVSEAEKSVASPEESVAATSVLETSISSSQVLTSPCSTCGKVSTKKDRVFECSKCKKLTHFDCTRLPAYAIFSLKSSKRQYVCAACSNPPEEYVKLYDIVEDEEKATTKEVISDVFSEIKRVGDAVTRFNIENMMETLQERLKVVDAIDSKLEIKVKAMENRIIERLAATPSPKGDVVTSPCECESLTEHLKAKESEISLLNDELKVAEKQCADLARKNRDLSEEVKNLRNENSVIANNLSQSSSSLESLRSKSEETGRQLLVSHQNARQLKIDVTDRDKALQVLNKERDDLTKKVDESLRQLNDMMKTIIERSGQSSGDSTTAAEVDDGEPDVIILHDSLFKAVKPEGLMRRERQKVVMKWAPKLKDALDIVVAMREKPKVVLLHVGTNDLNNAGEDGMVDIIKNIYDVLEARQIKLVYSFMLPTSNRAATAKAEVVNSRVVQEFAMKEDVFIGRNDNFYMQGVKCDRLFDDDGIHVNEDGTKALVGQTKDVLYRSLGLENRNRSYGNYNSNSYRRNGNGHRNNRR